MINDLPPLLITGHFPGSFDLQKLLQKDSVRSVAILNEGKYPGLNQFEVIANGIAFELQLFDEVETKNVLQENCTETLFGSAPKPGTKSIAVSLSDNLISGRHLPTINRALLAIAKLLGREVSASHISWLPAQQSIAFEHFEEAVDDYLAGGPVPVLIQIAIIKSPDGNLQTWGLKYFSDQEIILQPAPDMNDSEAIKRLVRISHDIAVNGRIDNELEADGIAKGERISYKPSSNFTELAVKIAFA